MGRRPEPLETGADRPRRVCGGDQAGLLGRPKPTGLITHGADARGRAGRRRPFGRRRVKWLWSEKAACQRDFGRGSPCRPADAAWRPRCAERDQVLVRAATRSDCRKARAKCLALRPVSPGQIIERDVPRALFDDEIGARDVTAGGDRPPARALWPPRAPVRAGAAVARRAAGRGLPSPATSRRSSGSNARLRYSASRVCSALSGMNEEIVAQATAERRHVFRL